MEKLCLKDIVCLDHNLYRISGFGLSIKHKIDNIVNPESSMDGSMLGKNYLQRRVGA